MTLSARIAIRLKARDGVACSCEDVCTERRMRRIVVALMFWMPFGEN